MSDKFDIDRVQDSCGYGVPRMDFVEDRSRLGAWVDQRSDDEIAEFLRVAAGLETIEFHRPGHLLELLPIPDRFRRITIVRPRAAGHAEYNAPLGC